jgi:hypothetical protein
MTAPFKRGTKLVYTCRKGHKHQVTYKKWMGFERSALIVVQFADRTESVVHVNDVKPV